LALYAMLLVAVLAELFRGVVRAPDLDSRVAASLLFGTSAGLLAQSVFEAWWTSPGSMESAMFWSSVGVASALARRQATIASADEGAAAPIFAFRPSIRPALKS
jgi:hypothetical protein